MSKGVIIIEKQYISRNNGLCRLNTQINENGETKILYAEVEEEYGKYLCIERADGVLYLILPVALRENYDIYSEVPITGIFLHNLNEILIPHLALGDKNIHSIKIYADVEDNLIGGVGRNCNIMWSRFDVYC